ncbi:hypothetical protein VPH35_026025 [Triticum aestivum]
MSTNNLSTLLRSAAMEDKTVILTFVNEALTLPGSLLELFLESFRLGVRTQPLLKHLVIVPAHAPALLPARRRGCWGWASASCSRTWTSCGSGTRCYGSHVGADIALACDQFLGDNPYDLDKAANGGFVYARPNERTLAFFQDWYDARNRYPGEVKKELGVCENKKNFYEVCTYHANCLIGLQKEIDTLAGVLDEWKQFRAQQELLGNSTTTLIY